MLKRIKTCFLNPGGLLIFDVSSHYKLSGIIGNNTFIHDGDDIFYAWENRYYKDKQLCDMYLNFFIKEKTGYRRFCERHLQRAYTENEIKKALKNAGFADVSIYEHLTLNQPLADSQRIVFVAR